MRLAILIVLVQLNPFTLSVASRCAGEAGWNSGVHLCACTVKARLDHGWSESSVLSAYYAKDATPTEGMIEEAKLGLSGDGCPTDAYFLFEEFSVAKLGLDKACATGRADENGKSVWSFPYRTFKGGCAR
ncbi:MAG TPA: hypothetical protein P5317_11645 [Myxococcota bacterium]|nr:hypothetical protein [Myxococcota bacterium]HRV18647.1 hypothetical protein [Myxococcota bacterium]